MNSLLKILLSLHPVRSGGGIGRHAGLLGFVSILSVSLLEKTLYFYESQKKQGRF